MKIEKVKEAVKKWSEIRTSAKDVISYLKQGCCFKIEKSQYEMWKKKSPESLHAYMGIFDTKLCIILIDSESDKDAAANEDCIFVQYYLPGLDVKEEGFIDNAVKGSVKVKEALKRSVQWTVFMESWVVNNVSATYGIFQAFDIPFGDIKKLFKISGVEDSIALFGLRSDNNQADLTFWGLKDYATEMKSGITVGAGVEDLVTPVPPMGSGVYSLLK